MTLIDRWRIEYAIQTYDFWLEARGASGRERRELRGELRDNLSAAAADVGVTQAVFNIGSPKRLAYEVTEPHRRPRWSRGLMWATVVEALTLAALLYAAVVFLSGVEASGVTGHPVTGGAFPWFGVEFVAEVEAGGGISAGVTSVWWWLLGPWIVTFVLVAQPWRALTRRKPTAGVSARRA